MTFSLVSHKLGYHKSVQRWIPASLARFGALLLPLVFLPVSQAQINSASASSSAHSFSVAPPTGAFAPPTHSVVPPTSGFVRSGYEPSNAGVARPTEFPHHAGGSHNTNRHHHHPANGTAYSDPYYYPYLYAVPYPVDSDATASDESNYQDQEEDDVEYQGGPTIFDRRGSGPDSYVPPVSEPQVQAQLQQPEPVNYASSAAPQVPTSLVFKDGHQLEVANYAIVSQTLYDLTPGHHRKIALADLDLPATEKQNDDRGVTFQLPPSAQAN
jgi:hypothetical protein